MRIGLEDMSLRRCNLGIRLFPARRCMSRRMRFWAEDQRIDHRLKITRGKPTGTSFRPSQNAIFLSERNYLL